MPLDFKRLLENVVSCNAGFSFGGRQEAGQNAHGGGFSRSVRPQETHDLTFLDFKTYVIYSRSPAIALGQTLHFYHAITRTSSGVMPNKLLRKNHRGRGPRLSNWGALGGGTVALATTLALSNRLAQMRQRPQLGEPAAAGFSSGNRCLQGEQFSHFRAAVICPLARFVEF